MAKLRKHLTDAEYAQLCRFVEYPKNVSPETIVVELLMRTGCRQGELVKIKIWDFDSKERKILISPLKGSSARIAKLPEPVWERVEKLLGYMRERGIETIGDVISGSKNQLARTRQVQRWTMKILAMALGPAHNFTVHALRHTYALRVHKAMGNDILKTRIAMGHKSVDTTARYLDYLKAEEIAEEAMEAMGA